MVAPVRPEGCHEKAISQRVLTSCLSWISAVMDRRFPGLLADTPRLLCSTRPTARRSFGCVRSAATWP